MKHEFFCVRCKQNKTRDDTNTTGYGEDERGEKNCFACCGEMDREYMKEHGKITLYLTPPKNGKDGMVSNWPGTLFFPVRSVKKGDHNIAGVRYDFRFTANGENWCGVQYGDYTQIAHCRRVK